MVHKKYIKRGDKIFGPYLYQNYRENGVTKTRYFGLAKKRKNFHISLSFVLIIAVLFILIISSLGLFLLEKEFVEEKGLATYSPLNFFKNLFTASSSLNVFLQIIDNHPPEFLEKPSEIFVCEGNIVNQKLFVNDSEGDLLTLSYEEYLGIMFSFFPDNEIDSFGKNWTNVNFTSGNPVTWRDIESRRENNNAWAIYPETILVSDGDLVESFDTNVVIIEVNNAPEFEIGVQTIDLYVEGENSSFYQDIGSLIGQGEETSVENLNFGLDFLDVWAEAFFNISDEGIINITGNGSWVLFGDSTTYHINVIIQDTGLDMRDEIHQNIGDECYNFGYNEDPKNWTDDFYLTITNMNRIPNITSYSPSDLDLSVQGTDVLYFNLTAYDADFTPLDVNWYVGNDSKDDFYYEGLNPENVSEFEHIFGCNVLGDYTIKAVVSDGLANDSIEWNLSVENVACPVPSLDSPGGGGGGGVFCKEKWLCNEWERCYNFNELVEWGWAGKETELLIKERCELFNYTEIFCGFQQRSCTDFNYCKSEFNKPGAIRECYYTENPSCEDKIKNCHDKECEVLVDCGGPCDACPTCSDNIKNQNEEFVDCGGPCKACVERPLPVVLFKGLTTYSLIILFILVLFLIFKQMKKYFGFKKLSTQTKKIEKNIVKTIPQKGSGRQMVGLFFIVLVVGVLFFANVYIMDFSGQKRITLPEEIGFLANYGFINGLFENFGLFFVSEVFSNINSNLQLGDDSDNEDRFTPCYEYCTEKKKDSPDLWNINFYADYQDLLDNPLDSSSGANCNIVFDDGTFAMNDNGGLWEYTRTFDYKGDYFFDVECTYGGETNIGNEEFTIRNTEPYILETTEGYLDFDGNRIADILQCHEDVLCYYNFSANVSEDDLDDKNNLIFEAIDFGTDSLTDYIINETTGMLEINITNGDYTGSKTVELIVRDSESFASSILQIDVSERNDPPIFENLEDQELIIDDLFGYDIIVSDEEWDFPFEFNIDFLSCSPELLGNCDLFGVGDYTIDGSGVLSLGFTPLIAQEGEYEINFSVSDTNLEFGNAIMSKVIKFTVTTPIWLEPLELNYTFNETEAFYLDLSENVSNLGGVVSFSNEETFPGFDLTSEGIISFTPEDEDVGNWFVEITADNSKASSLKIFNFTILNKDDKVSVDSLAPSGHIFPFQNSILNVYENKFISLNLFIKDDDFAIDESQKSFYDENLSLYLTITGPNSNLFNFSEQGLESDGITMKYLSEFTARDGEEGIYNVRIEVWDGNDFSFEFYDFSLNVINLDYDIPIINYPNVGDEFNFIEGVGYDLIFNVSHAVGDNLDYYFYIGDEFREKVEGFGNGMNFTYEFTPRFTDETYGNKTNLKVLVMNPLFNEFNASRTWEVMINHSNAPVQLIDEIDDRELEYNSETQIILKENFLDVDYEDEHYRQNVSFNITSGSNHSDVIIEFLDDWTIMLSTSRAEVFNETLMVTAYDLNMSNESLVLTNVSSNYFNVKFKEPTIVEVPIVVRVPGRSSSTRSGTPISLKIISPRDIFAFEGDTLEIPLQLINTGKMTFSNLNLNSSAFKDSDLFSEIKTSLDISFFSSLKPGQKENLTLTVEFPEGKVGSYEILIEAESESPNYRDWEKILIKLSPINESQVKELIVFTEAFIVANPKCVELTEIIVDAEKYLNAGDYLNAKIKTEEALNSCKEGISQVSIPITRMKYFKISLYLLLSVGIAFVVGLIYYFFKRRNLLKQNKSVPMGKVLNQ